MIIRPIEKEDAKKIYNMLCLLDKETDYMMYEPEERKNSLKSFSHMEAIIEDVASGNDFLLVAENNEKDIVGYIRAERGKLNRIKHSAYIVVGILERSRGQGIGSSFFHKLDTWARENNIIRLELSVECENNAAKKLYEKQGFKVEGLREKSMKVSGQFRDEYYMSKIFV